jgi:hypothetical protein
VQALSAAPPDVWVQLLEHCAKDPAAPAWLAQLSSLARKVQQVQMVVAAAADAAGIVLPPEVAEARGEVEACLRELRELAAKWPHAQEG